MLNFQRLIAYYQCTSKKTVGSSPIRNVVRSFVSNREPHDYILLSKRNVAQAYVPKRRLGWLFAPTLKPGQKGYEKQRKMRRRFNVANHIFAATLLYYMYSRNILFNPLLTPKESFFELHRTKAERITAQKEAQDQELLRLAELRRRNAELYPLETIPELRKLPVDRSK